MALQFPNSPTNGEVYTDPVTGNRYTYDSANTAWLYTANSIVSLVSDTQIIFKDGAEANGSNGMVFIKAANTVFFDNVNVSQNVTATYFVGNGALLTGLVTDYSPAFNAANGAATNAKAALTTPMVSTSTLLLPLL